MLKGIVSLVTGGASGLGRATAQRFVQQGGCAVICDLPTSKGSQTASMLGDSAVFVPTDVTSEADVEHALAVCKDKFGRLDVAVNCAGIAMAHVVYNPRSKTVYDQDTFMQVLKVCLGGTFNVIRLCVPLISDNEPNKDGQRGVIINTASISAFDGQIGQSAISASHGGVVGMTLPIARDLSKIGIRVCTIAAGHFDTPTLDYLPREILDFLTQNNAHPKRLGDPDEYAQLAQSIVCNPMLNGEVLRLTAGLRLCL